MERNWIIGIAIVITILVIVGVIILVVMMKSKKDTTEETGTDSSTTSLIIDNLDIAGFDMPGMPLKNMASLDECFKACQDNDKCHWVNYVKGNKDCYLKSTQYASDVVTQTDGFFLDNSDIPRFDMPGMPLKDVASAEECYQKCQQSTDPKCHWINYVKGNKDCYLKSGQANSGVMTQFKKNT